MLLEKRGRTVLLKRAASSTVFFIFWGVTLLFFLSQLSIPLSPVPITLQTVAVMLIGLTFERRAAVGSVLTYLSLGGVGFPVFSSFSAGVSVLLGPRGGYLVGFFPAVVLMTMMREKGNYSSVWGSAFTCFVGTVTVFLCGVAWLSTFLGVEQAVVHGVLPFILPGFLKIGVLVGLMFFLKGPQRRPKNF